MSRKIELLKLLFKELTFKPASYFSNKLIVSCKTIYSDIEELNHSLSSMPEKKIYIEKSPRKGLKLIGHKEDIDKVIAFLNTKNSNSYYNTNAIRLTPYYRRLDIIKRCLLNKEFVSLEQLSLDYIVSKTSLLKDIELINASIIKYNVSLKINSKSIDSIGQEIQIQRAIKYFLTLYISKQNTSELNQLMQSFLDDNSFEKISLLLFKQYEKLIQKTSDYYLSSLLISIAIQLKRLRINCHIGKEDDFLFNHIRYMQSYLIASELAEKLVSDFDVTFTTDDIEFLSKQFFAHRMSDEKFKISDKLYAEIIDQMIRKISEIERVDLSKDKKLYHSLLQHFPAMITRLQKKIEVINPILNDIKTEYSKLFSVLWYALSNLERQFHIDLNDHEISFLLIHFQIALDKAADANNIILICPYGLSSNLILNKVRQLLPSKDNIEVYPLSKIQLSQLDNVDLIITTVDINYINKPIVKISSLLNAEDYQNLIQAYTNYVLNKHNNDYELVGNAVSIAKFINQDIVYFNVDVENKAQCLDIFLNQLEKKKYVNSNYRASVLHREIIGNTSIENGIALPHGSSMFVSKSSISIMTTNKPIKWGVIDVNIIIMVSLSEMDIGNINDVYTEIYKIVSNKDLVFTLQTISDFKQLKLFLINEKDI